MSYRPQHGAALIVAMLVAGLVAVIAALIASDYQLNVRRARNQLLSEQAYQYLIGAEELAIQALRKDLKVNIEIDHLGEDWAREFTSDAIEGGLLNIKIEDLQGRFNINSLAVSGPASGTPLPNTDLQRYFVRLLLSFKIPDLNQDRAVQILEALVDWLDKDQNETGFGGAEDSEYESMEPAYRTANQVLSAPSELRLVKGMTDKIYAALLPNITVWPATGSSININTATGPVLAALNGNGAGSSTGIGESLGDQELDLLLESRMDEGFESIATFIDHPVWGGRPLSGPALEQKSQVFIVYGLVELHGFQQRLTSILWRDSASGDIQVLMRSIGGF